MLMSTGYVDPPYVGCACMTLTDQTIAPERRWLTKKAPPKRGFFIATERSGDLLPKHEIVELLLDDAEPNVFLGEEFLPRVVDFLELRIARGFLAIEFLRCFVAGVQNLAGERAKLDAVGDQPAERRRIVGVVLADLPHIAFGARGREHCLIGLRQLLPLLEIDVDRALRLAFPPTRVIIVFGDLVEA